MRSRRLPAGSVATWDSIRRGANAAAAAKGEWAGAPIPIHNLKLVIEPRHPFRGLNGKSWESMDDAEAENLPQGWSLVNYWYSRRRDMDVCWFRGPDGRVRASGMTGARLASGFQYLLNTFCVGADCAWTVAAEKRAMDKLKELLRKNMYESYFLTGTFLETSKRSNVTYLFRKLRPTLALRPCKSANGNMFPIAALCLHPVGFYERSFAGCMVPTDDVIAHLLLMRGDERKFWAKANHHNLESAEAGI